MRRYSADNTRWLPLSPVQFHVLVALTKGPAHGYAILKDVERRSGGRITPSASTLYGVIARLEEDGLIQEVHPSPQPHFDLARRRYYALTETGNQVGQAERERLEALIGQMEPDLFVAWPIIK
jgi:DNA-binding PadR family transcriptional regulator